MNELSSQKSLAMAELNPVITELSAFENTIEGFEVVDETAQGQLGDFVKLLTSREKTIDTKRISLTKPLNTVVKDINAMFKIPLDRIAKMKAIARKKLSRFAEAKLAIERAKKEEEERIAREEAAAAAQLAKDMAANAGNTGKEVGEQLVLQAEETVEKIKKKEAKVAVNRGQTSSVITTKTWRAEVVNKEDIVKAVAAGRLPLEFLDINMAALQKNARDTQLAREVDGVRYWEEIGTTVR